MNQVTTRRKSFVIAHGRYDIAGYDAKVYQFTRTGVGEWAWNGVNNPLPPDAWSLREVRTHCSAAVRKLAEAYQAEYVGIKLRPSLRSIQRLLTKQGCGAISGEYKLLDQALIAFGNASRAVVWLTTPSAACRGELPALHAAKRDGRQRVLHALLRKEYEGLLQKIPPVTKTL